MVDNENNGIVKTAIIVGCCLIVGLTAAGYLIGRGAVRFKSEVRTVTVKGLVEREVNADEAVWTLSFRRAGNDLKGIQVRISADRDAVLDFLSKRGFTDDEIKRQPVRAVDKLAREYGPPQVPEPFRYIVTSALVVRTPKIDLVQRSLDSTDELLNGGVILDGEARGGVANPRYLITRFNDLRPQLLADATKNARAVAQQFAADSGASVGKIRSANQGSIQIFGSDGNNESGPYSPTSTPVKKIRVVSTFEFELR